MSIVPPQELASVMDLSVYENIFIGREIRGPFGLQRKKMIEEARKNLEVFGLDIDPATRMGSLPVGLRQIIEIIKATNTGARTILLDEPSSAIAEREVERLISVMRHLRDRGGVALLFTTHKMEEIRAVADRVIVLRDGGLVLDKPPLAELSDDDIVTAMIGRELEDLFPERNTPAEETVLEVDGLYVNGAGGPVSVSVRRGEIVGLAGLVGAGRTELLETIFGMRRTMGGEVRVLGKSVKKHSPSAAIDARIAIVPPEDRKGSGAILSMDVLDNGSLPRLSHYSTAGGFLKQAPAARQYKRQPTRCGCAAGAWASRWKPSPAAINKKSSWHAGSPVPSTSCSWMSPPEESMSEPAARSTASS